jgi:nucleotide-binding universal stress UspA family protein
LGSTVGSLVRKSSCPVLTVKRRLPKRAYRHIAVGIDMSPASEKALLYALKVFPEAQKITAIHAIDMTHPL